nr:Nitrite reductase [NAD(P)H] [Virgibacillus halodenitrificans]
MSAYNEHLVIVGNGMAGHRLLETVLAHPHRPRHITILGDEPASAYNRILLSPWLAGDMDRETLTLRHHDWYAAQGVSLIVGERVTAIDRQCRTLTTDQGRRLAYDRLVLATGSRAARPAVPGSDLDGIHAFRDLEDGERLASLADAGGRAVVIGGGLLGLEAAEGMRKRGMTVSVVHRATHLMNRQLDPTAADMLAAELGARGLEIHTGADLAAYAPDADGQRATGVVLSDGTTLTADCVVAAIGIVPNTSLAERAGLATARGIQVDAFMNTSDPHISALGECCEFEGTTYGLVEPIWRQAEVLAARLCGDTPAPYRERPCATKLKVSGISLYAFGPIAPTSAHEVLTYHDPQHGDYRRLLLRDGVIDGAVLYGDTGDGPWYFQCALAGEDLSACRQALLFGASDAQPLLDKPDTLSEEAA